MNLGDCKDRRTFENDKKMPVERVSLAVTTGEPNRSRSQEGNCTEFPVLHFSRRKRNGHKSLKRGRYMEDKPSTSCAEDSDDNQTADTWHHTRIRHDTVMEDETKPKRWACEAETLSGCIDDNLLPQLVTRSVVPSPQKMNSILRGAHIRKTWKGTLRPQSDSEGFQFSHGTFQRRASSSDATVATFEATETILTAEIDSDERCASFLRQRVPRETLNLHPDADHSSQSQIHYKLRALDRKIQMNKEKLAQVRERVAKLEGKPSFLAAQDKPEQKELLMKKSGQVAAMLDINQQTITIMGTSALKKEVLSASTAALVIQCGFRAFRARRCLADLLVKTYRRILYQGSKECFYYNRTTKLSQWEAPILLRHCHCPLDDKHKPAATLASPTASNDPALDVAAKIIQLKFRERALKVFMQDIRLGNLEKVFDTGFGAWYYYNARTNRSFWESVHHVRLTACNSAIYHRQQPWQTS